LILWKTIGTSQLEHFIICPQSRQRKNINGELANRKELSFPPFSQLIKLTYAHKDPIKAEQEGKILKNKLETEIRNFLPSRDLPQGEKLEIRNFHVLGPAPAFIPRVNNRYIWQIMIKSKIKELALRNKLLRVIPNDWKIDVDPVEML